MAGEVGESLVIHSISRQIIAVASGLWKLRTEDEYLKHWHSAQVVSLDDGKTIGVLPRERGGSIIATFTDKKQIT